MSKKNIIETISPDDEMMRYSDSKAGYMAASSSGLECILLALRAARKNESAVGRILDLPCGHGRVLRSIRAHFPQSEIVACDLVKNGVDFCAETFGAVGVYSKPDPVDVKLPGQFDLIWSGSLLTHLSEEHATRFLNFYIEYLNEFGVLVFSTHGRFVCRNLSDQDGANIRAGFFENGYGYNLYENEDRPGYGLAVQKLSWVVKFFEKRDDLKIVLAGERLWNLHHDVIAVQKIPADGWKTWF